MRLLVWFNDAGLYRDHIWSESWVTNMSDVNSLYCQIDVCVLRDDNIEYESIGSTYGQLKSLNGIVPIACMASMGSSPWSIDTVLDHGSYIYGYLGFNAEDGLLVELDVPETRIVGMRPLEFNIGDDYVTDKFKKRLRTTPRSNTFVAFIREIRGEDFVAAYQISKPYAETGIGYTRLYLNPYKYPLWTAPYIGRASNGNIDVTPANGAPFGGSPMKYLHKTIGMQGAPRYFTAYEALQCCEQYTCNAIEQVLQAKGISILKRKELKEILIMELFPDGMSNFIKL